MKQKKKGVDKEQHFSSFNLHDDGHLIIIVTCGYIKLKLEIWSEIVNFVSQYEYLTFIIIYATNNCKIHWKCVNVIFYKNVAENVCYTQILRQFWNKLLIGLKNKIVKTINTSYEIH